MLRPLIGCLCVDAAADSIGTVISRQSINASDYAFVCGCEIRQPDWHKINENARFVLYLIFGPNFFPRC